MRQASFVLWGSIRFEHKWKCLASQSSFLFFRTEHVPENLEPIPFIMRKGYTIYVSANNLFLIVSKRKERKENDLETKNRRRVVKRND
jgi:hypothetical protein